MKWLLLSVDMTKFTLEGYKFNTVNGKEMTKKDKKYQKSNPRPVLLKLSYLESRF